MGSILTGLGLVLVGLVSAFLGYRMFRILLPIYGGITGFLLAWSVWGETNVILALVIGVVIAVVLGVLAYGIWSVLIGFGGVILGLALASIIVSSLNLGSWLAVIVGLACAVIFGALFVRIRNEMVVVLTGLAGAAAVAGGVGQWLGLRSGFDAARNPNPVWLIVLMIVIFAVVAFLGIRYQWRNYQQIKLAAEKEKASKTQQVTTPTTAMRQAPAVAVDGAGSVAPVAAVGAAGVAVAAAVDEDKRTEVAPAAGEVVEAPVAAAAVVAATEPEPADAPVAEVAKTAAAGEEAAAEEAAVETQAAEVAVVDAPVTGAVVAGAVAAAAIGEQRGDSAETAVELDVEPAVAAGAVAVAAEGEASAETAEAETEVGAEEIVAGGAGGVVAPAAMLAGAALNKVEDELPVEANPADAEASDDSPKVVDEVVKGIEATYSFDDIAKFKEKLQYVEGIGATYAEKLQAAGIDNVLDLLKRGASRKGRQELVEATGISGKLILRWVNHADLYRVKGVGSEYADLLEAAGVDTVVELAHRNPANLLNAMTDTNKVRNLVRKEPVASQVEDWVAQAKKLPRVIQY